ncbi:class I SAM-dependent methyltransferase [Nocardiopsis composta]
MTEQTWNAELYDTRHSFVAAHGGDLLDLLAVRPGERVLDAGCGTGEHAARLREAGAAVVGVDASPEMIGRARSRFPGLDLRVADLRSLGLGGFDAVLSNAVLHWIPEADRAAASLAAALRPGGRLVAELGGAGNIAAIDAGARAVRAERGCPTPPRRGTSPDRRSTPASWNGRASRSPAPCCSTGPPDWRAGTAWPSGCACSAPTCSTGPATRRRSARRWPTGSAATCTGTAPGGPTTAGCG